MFALTRRLVLRPAWPEEAGDLHAAIAHEVVAMKLARLPWPYTPDDAAAWLALERSAHQPNLQIFARDSGREPRLVGGVGIDLDSPHGGPELGYWLTPAAWGRGYATEAARALVGIARDALRLDRLVSGHFVDNPASGNVLRKVGFVATGEVASRSSLARGVEVDCVLYEMDLREAGRMAA